MKKSKIFSRLVSAFMVMAMVMTFGLSALAAGGSTQGGTGTITVNNASKKVGSYVAADDGTFKQNADGKYVKAEDGYAGQKYKYQEVDNNTYTAYRIFQASPADNGDDKTKPTTTWGGEDKNNVGYTATAAQRDALVAIDGATALFAFTATAKGDYAVKLQDGKTAKDVAAFFNKNQATIKTKSGTFPSYPMDINEAAKTATATVPFGYYFITSSNGTVVSVDTTNKNVVVNDKNTYAEPFNPGDDDDPTNDDLKNITAINGQTVNPVKHDATSASIGDILTYTIKNNSSNFVVEKEEGVDTSKKVSYVYVNDTIGKGLKYYTDETYKFTVKVGNTELTKAGSKFATQGATKQYYIVEKTEGDGAAYDGDAFTVVIPWLDENGDPAFDDNAVVTVTYSAQLDEYVDEVAGKAAGDNSVNKADVKYDTVDPDNKPENPPTDPTPGAGGTKTGVEEDTVKVFVYALAIQKFDAADRSALAGAHFEIKDAAGNIIIAKKTSDTEKRYMFDSTAKMTDGNVPTGYTKDFETNDEGQIILYGVKEGTYTVTETDAPAGYNLATESFTIDASVAEEKTTTTTISVTTYFVQDNAGTYKKVDDKFVKIANGETVDDANRYAISKTTTENTGSVDFTTTENVRYAAVENEKGTELPSTGGIGTTIFYVIGTILVLGAGVLLVTKRRMAE